MSLTENVAQWLVDEGLVRYPMDESEDNADLPVLITTPRAGTPSPDDLREDNPPIEADAVIGLERRGGIPSPPGERFIRRPQFDLTVRCDSSKRADQLIDDLVKALNYRVELDMSGLRVHELMLIREPFALPHVDDPAHSYRMSFALWYFDE